MGCGRGRDNKAGAGGGVPLIGGKGPAVSTSFPASCVVVSDRLSIVGEGV